MDETELRADDDGTTETIATTLTPEPGRDEPRSLNTVRATGIEEAGIDQEFTSASRPHRSGRVRVEPARSAAQRERLGQQPDACAETCGIQNRDVRNTQPLEHLRFQCRKTIC